MYQLYYYPANANAAPHMLLEEIGAPYELVLVDRKTKAQKAPAYLAINPNGRIPTLVKKGRPVFESAAIILTLVDDHPEAGFAPQVGTAGREAFYQWLIFLTNSVQEGLMTLHFPERLVGENAEAAALVKAGAEKRLGALLTVIEQHLKAHGPYFLGETVSAVDLYMTMLARWAMPMSRPPRAYPHIAGLLDRVTARPAVRRAYEQEGITGVIA